MLLSLHTNAAAGDLSAGVFNSPKGFGISLDYYATQDIYNSYTAYAYMYRMFFDNTENAGVKFMYLHYNRLKGWERNNARFDLFIGPGASTGYVRDNDSEAFGMILTADIAIALRIRFTRSIDMEISNVAELGFIARDNKGKSEVSIYNDGLIQTILPALKLMIRF